MDLTSFYPRRYPTSYKDKQFKFVTDYGAEYSLFFEPGMFFGGLPYAHKTYDINLVREKKPTIKPRPTTDIRIESTFVFFANRLFDDPETVLIYYCSHLQGKHLARKELFEEWVSRWNSHRGNDIEHISNDFIDKSGTSHHSSCLVLKSNSYVNDIKIRFPEHASDK